MNTPSILAQEGKTTAAPPTAGLSALGAQKALKKDLQGINKKADPQGYLSIGVQLGYAYLRAQTLDSALGLGWKLLHYGKMAPLEQRVEVFQLLGNTYIALYLSDSALYYYELAHSEDAGLPAGKRMELLEKLSKLHLDNGSLSHAQDYCIAGIRLADLATNNTYKALFNTRIGMIYEKETNIIKAKEYYTTAMNTYATLNDEKGLAMALAHLGNASKLMGEYALAAKHYNEAKSLYTKLRDNTGIACMLDGLGELEYLKGRYNEATALQHQALSIRAINRNYGELPQSYVNLANSYLKLKRYDDALELTRNGIGLTKKTGADVQLLDLYNQFYLIYKDLNYKDSALWYHERYAKLKDSLDRLSNDEWLIRLQNAFDTERREVELAEVKREKEVQDERLRYYQKLETKDNALKILLVSVIIILIVVALLFFSRYRIKSKANQEIYRKVKENELLLKELHHRVKNNLQFITSLFSIKLDKIKDPDAQVILHENLQKVKAMSLVHNQLNSYGSSDKSLFLGDFVAGLTQSLALSLGLDPDQLSLVYRWRKTSFDLDSYNAIGLVINEMITNSVKHGNPEELQIRIGFYENEKYKLMRYADNGPGLNPDFFTSDKQMGISLMKLMVEDFGGSLKYLRPKEGENGIRININIRKTKHNG
ncbi:MAG: tetratricopeptide repeat protein [Bacteroidetes bacterium]|nr:tetratricopeptide repeat protein [Bacteroidota bacterium]